MQKGNLSRRGFMQRSLAALAAAGLPSWYAREVFAEETKGSKSSGERLLMGAIGIGSPSSRNRDLYRSARREGKDFVRYIAACDVDRRHLDNALAMMKND